MAMIGGADGVAGVYSLLEQKVVQALKTGGGAVTAAVWWDAKPIVATSTGSIKVFSDASTGSEAVQLGSHAGAATTIALHPSGEILASAGIDKTYKLYDLSTMKLATQVVTPSGQLSTSRQHESELICYRYHMRRVPPGWPPIRSRISRWQDPALRCQVWRRSGCL